MDHQLTTSHHAEKAFYRAFEAADLQAMMAIWANNNDIVCIHPMGQLLRGRQSITESWRAIFKDSPRLRFQLSNVQVSISGDIAIHTLTERIIIMGHSLNAASVIATNVYRLIENNWYLILHHSSPIPPMEMDNPPDTKEETTKKWVLH